MKKIIALTLSALTFSSVSNAWIIKGNNSQPERQRYVSVEECSASLFQNMSTYESETDAACSFGRTEYEFQRCVITVVREIGDRNVQVAGQACAATGSAEIAQCAADLYFRGGLYIVNRGASSDGARVCANSERYQIKNCIIDQYQNNRQSGEVAARTCIEKYDPVARARREAELRRIEEDKRRQAEEARRAAEQRAAAQRAAEQRAAEQRAADQRAAEQRRLDEQRRQEEQRRQSTEQQQQQQRTQEQKRQEELRRQQEEQRKKDEEARKKKEEEEKKKQQEQQKQPSNPPANNGGGVIVDLPAFE
ncbi:hypothetical protein [Bdellovibrio sp. HCB-162]|uniref:hypothetical protein n=1 Tax=Bdellovibrio sp. HCB-162 TaxID=3394234 RepID=UPI0039BC7079